MTSINEHILIDLHNGSRQNVNGQLLAQCSDHSQSLINRQLNFSINQILEQNANDMNVPASRNSMVPHWMTPPNSLSFWVNQARQRPAQSLQNLSCQPSHQTSSRSQPAKPVNYLSLCFVPTKERNSVINILHHNSNNTQMNDDLPGDSQLTPPGSSLGPKRKKTWSRAVFSGAQREGLESSFQCQKYISKADRKHLAQQLGLTDAQIKVWFQNRRMKWRHEILRR